MNYRSPHRGWHTAIAAAIGILLPVCGLCTAVAESSTAPSRLPTRAAAVSDVTFVVFDTETTGFSPSTDRMVELGAVKFRNGKVIDEKSWLINPQRRIPVWNRRVHGISDEDVKGQPVFSKVYPEFEQFIDGCVLIAHNARFDINFLTAEIKRAGLSVPRNGVIDSLALFRSWFPRSKSHALQDVARATDIPVDVLHRATADSLYVFHIFDKGLKARDAKLKLRDIYADSGGLLKF